MNGTDIDSRFASSLQHEHAQLQRAIAEIHGFLSAPQRRKAAVADSISRFAESVESHFCREESNCFPDALQLAPLLANRARALLQEHVTLLEQIQSLCILSRSGIETVGWWRIVEHRLDEFAARLSDHEMHENALLRDSSNAEPDTSE